MRVLVADADPVARLGLEAILTQEHDITVVAAQNGAEVEKLVANHHWDVVVLDSNLKARDGATVLELLRGIKRRHHRLPILVLSSDDKENFVLRALRSGAAGYISKRATPTELVRAVRRLGEGRKYMYPAAAEELLAALENGGDWVVRRLSDREYEILCLLGSGKSVRQIAYELRRSAKTIHTHRARILEKLKMQTDAQLVQYVLHRRLVESP